MFELGNNAIEKAYHTHINEIDSQILSTACGTLMSCIIVDAKSDLSS